MARHMLLSLLLCMYVAIMFLPVIIAGFVFFWRLRDDVEKERTFRAKLAGVKLD
jgi:hypothetical protein